MTTLDFNRSTQYFYNPDGTLAGTETEPDIEAELANLKAGQAGDFDQGDPFAFGGNPIVGQNPFMQVQGDFQRPINSGNMGITPMHLPGYDWGTGIGGLLPSGQGNWLQGMISQYDTAWQQEQARRDMYARWREQQAHLERMQDKRLAALDKFNDAFSGGGGDFKLPRGYKTDTASAYHRDPEDLPAVAKGDIPGMMPVVPELNANMNQDFVGAAPALQILNRIGGQGAQAGLDEAGGKIIEELNQKQANLEAGKDAAKAEQGVSQHRWVQNLQEAINQVKNRADQNALQGDRLRQSAYQKILGPGTYS